MGTQEEPPFKKPVVPQIVTIALMVVVFVTHIIQFNTAGDWSVPEYVITNAVIIIWGFVIPAVIIVLVLVGKQIYENSEYIPLIFGIIVVVLSGILTAMGTYWVVDNIINLVENAYYGVVIIVCYVIQLACLAVIIVMQIKSLMSGIDLIKYYQANQPA